MFAMKKVGKIIKKVLLVLLILLLVLVIAVAVIAGMNAKAMNACVEDTIALVSQGHTVTPVDAGEYGEMTVYGIMKFHVKQYDVEDLGNLSVMTVNVGVMQMATVVFTPLEKDLPLLSCDYMYMLTNRKAYVELYDLVEEKDNTYLDWLDRYAKAQGAYGDLTDSSASSAWYDDLLTVVTYKTGGRKDDNRLECLLLDTVGVYLAQADAYGKMGADARAAKVAILKDYSDRLIDEGGVSTTFFKQSLGEDVTRDFFDKVFFGTERAK